MANRASTLQEIHFLLQFRDFKPNRRHKRAAMADRRKGNNGQSGFKQTVEMANGKTRVIHHNRRPASPSLHKPRKS